MSDDSRPRRRDRHGRDRRRQATRFRATRRRPDVNYVFPTFVTTQLAARARRADHRRDLRRGDVGHRRRAERARRPRRSSTSTSACCSQVETDAHYLFVLAPRRSPSGASVACVVAHVAVQLGSLIEVVNRIGSIFYGSLLGVFVLALGFAAPTAPVRSSDCSPASLRDGLRVPPADARHLVSLAQSDRRRGRRRRRTGGQPLHEADARDRASGCSRPGR